MNIDEIKKAKHVYNEEHIEILNHNKVETIDDFKLLPRQKYMMGLNPQFLQKDDGQKALNVDNMRYFYGTNYNITMNNDLQLKTECKEQVQQVIQDVCEAIR